MGLGNSRVSPSCGFSIYAANRCWMLPVCQQCLGLALVSVSAFGFAGTAVHDPFLTARNFRQHSIANVMEAPPKWVFVIPIIMSLIAIADLPYGYYQLLRIVVMVASIWLVAYYWSKQAQTPAVVFGCIGILFNPVFKIHMERETHLWFNIAAAAIFAVALFTTLRTKHRASVAEPPTTT